VTSEVRAAASVAPVEAADAEAICELAGVIWRAHYADIVSGAQIEYMLRQRYDPALIRAELARGDIAWDKLVVNGTIAGYASYFTSAREMKLDKLYVHHDHQRRGYGGLLIKRAAAAARAQGRATLMLAVNKANAKAIAAYRKYGFRIRESIVQDIGGGFVMDDYVMVKDV
jgi:ribosomal protein S18 acetylase RimI-like enzyme